MIPRAFSRVLVFLISSFFRSYPNPKYFERKMSKLHANGHCKFQAYPSLVHKSELSKYTFIFSVEGALLKSSSLFPYFMLVAFEAGSLFRALVLLVLYPFICLVGKEIGLKIMVMVCFLGIKKDCFRVGSNVLPKFFLEDVGFEGFEVLRRGKKMVAVSNMPQVMIESFLKDYLEIEFVVGRELKVFHGYYVGLMEKENHMLVLDKIYEAQIMGADLIGVTAYNKSADHRLFYYCKEIYLTSKGDKRKWQLLPRDRYPKPLIFHDGRLAFKPTPLATVALFMWLPFGFVLAIIRITVANFLPYNISIAILVFSGCQLKVTRTPNFPTKKDNLKGLLYVCNHRTLFDPVYLSFALKKDLTAVTYSVSKVSELLSPIKTVRMTRERDQDAKIMEKLLHQGDVVVCPEGTTCREPYLLRFSPLFSEVSNDIVPVAMGTQVSMFYGTTASGLKSLDSLFFLMNPSPKYIVKLLDKVPRSFICANGGESRFNVANHVQSELGKALGFECTKLTRKDKYLILAGNEGIASTNTKAKNIMS